MITRLWKSIKRRKKSLKKKKQDLDDKIENFLRWLESYEYVGLILDSLRSYSRFPRGCTVIVHIGKCGGRSVRSGIKNAQLNSNVRAVHYKRPIYRKDLKYIIVARGPVSRLISAFNWRYKLVVSDGGQRNRFKGEYEALVKYGHLNNLAEALYYEDGASNETVQKEIRKIHHMREDIAYYLKKLLSRCQPNQIIAVLMQENLDDDILRVFGYQNELRMHSNPVNQEDKTLSETAYANLMRFFWEDYAALTKLFCWGKIESNIFKKAIDSARPKTKSRDAQPALSAPGILPGDMEKNMSR